MFGVRSKVRGWLANDEKGISFYRQWDLVRPRFNKDTDIETEELAHLLSNRRRNIVIVVMNNCYDLTINDLAETVALNENIEEAGIDVYNTDSHNLEEYQPDKNHVENVRNSLKRNHIPRLKEVGIVRWDKYETSDEGKRLLQPGENVKAAYSALDEVASTCETQD